jgi:putative transposase
MPRCVRYNIKNGFYHVINRGAARRHIFVEDCLKNLFLEVLQETIYKYNFNIYSYCIMGNHYHLLVQTPEANLSDGMRYLNSRYAMAYNLRRMKDGPIFKDRFKSIYISNQRYLFNVTRYIHLNPVEANLVENPEDYMWSSYRDYINLHSDMLDLSSLRKSVSSVKYKEFVNKGNSDFIKSFYTKTSVKNLM